jgi:hypothetical protein
VNDDKLNKWKDFLIVLLEGGNSITLLIGSKYDETPFFLKENIMRKAREVISKEKIKKKDLMEVLGGFINEDLEDIYIRFVRRNLFLLERLGFVNTSENVLEIESGLHKTIKYELNEKGIEAALKIQEHNDNERRHKISTNIGIGAFVVSIFLLAGAIFSGVMNYKRLELLESKNIEFIDTQERIIKELKRPGDKKSVEIILKYEDDKIIVKDDL